MKKKLHLLLLALLMPLLMLAENQAYAVFDESTGTLTFYYDDQKASRGGIEINNQYIGKNDSSPYGSATKAVFDASFANYLPESTAYWFMRCGSLTSIVGIENLNTANVTDMHAMFSGCSELTSLDVSGFKTDNVTNMESMFFGCSSLTSLDLRGLNTANVTSMNSMFSGCSGLTSLDVTGFKTANVEYMGFMFAGCSGLTSLDVSGFKTDNVTSMNDMFISCSGLTSLDVSGFNTTNVTNMDRMFLYCSDLTTIYASEGWSTAAVTQGVGMFYGCTSLVGGAGTTYSDDHSDYTYAHIDGGTENPGYFTAKEAKVEVVTVDDAVYQLDEEGNVTFVGVDKSKAVGDYVIPETIKVDNVEVPVKEIAPNAFENCTGLVSVTIPANIQVIGAAAFKGCTGLEEIYCLSAVPIDLSKVFASRTRVMLTRSGEVITQFEGIDFETCILYVPVGSKELYQQAEGWKEFKNIVEMGETISLKYNKLLYCSDNALDFSGRDDVKAFIVTGYDEQGETSTIWLTRVTDVPARTPIVLKGTAGESYDIPIKTSSSSHYVSMLGASATSAEMTIDPTDGAYTNFVMSGGEFTKVSSSLSLPSNRGYLQLPLSGITSTSGSSQTFTIGATGKTTLCSAVDLDFSSLDSKGVKAFIVTGYDNSSKVIWLTRVNRVPAGVGLVVKGPEGTHSVPSSGVKSSYVNMLVGGSGGNISQTDGIYTNYVMSGGSFMPLSSPMTFPEGKAYLQIPTEVLTRSSDAGSLSYSLSEESEVISLTINTRGLAEGGAVTGIDSVEDGKTNTGDDDVYYNLQGQRVDNPGKGLYIKNGKKVIVR